MLTPAHGDAASPGHQASPPAVSAAPSNFSGPDQPLFDDYSKCIHCGLCLNHCPTYRELGVEMDSPRGRIYQIVQVAEGRLRIADRFVEHIDLCLECRACETACPSGVQYGKLVEAARAQIERHYRRPLLTRLARGFVFRRLLPSPALLRAAGWALWTYQASGLQQMVRRSGLLEGTRLAGIEALAPAPEPPFFFRQIGKVHPARGQRRYRVALFAGCIANICFTKLNEATVRVLTANGCEVVIPRGQTCCGALAIHAGLRDDGRRLARQNLRAFSRDECDAIITNAAGCGSTLKEYRELLAGDTGCAADAAAFSRKMKDVTEFLAEIGLVQPLGRVEAVATYQDSCHLNHGQRIRAAPRELIRQVPGVEFRELPLSDICCGSAGIYNVLHNDLALSLLEKKMEMVRLTRAQLVLTANPGCLLQLRAGVARWGNGPGSGPSAGPGAGQAERPGTLRVLHVVELLDESARAAEPLKAARGQAALQKA